jgi:hypothetical protein
MLDPVGGAKWDAWYSRKGLVPTKVVQEQYVALLLKYDPKWLPPLSCLKFKPQQVQLDNNNNNKNKNNNLSDEVQDGDDDGSLSPRSGTHIDGTKKNKKKKNKNNNNNNNTDDGNSSNSSTSLSGNKRSNSAGSLLTVNTKHSMVGEQQQQDKPPTLVRVNSILGLSSNDDEDVERVSKKGWLFKMRVYNTTYNLT